MAFTYGTIWGDYGDEKVTGTTQLHPLSTRMVLPDNRVYYYGQTDGAQTSGAICQSAVGVANHDMDLAVNTASAGAKSLSITLGATAATEDQYKDGYVYVNDGTGEAISTRSGSMTRSAVVLRGPSTSMTGTRLQQRSRLRR